MKLFSEYVTRPSLAVRNINAFVVFMVRKLLDENQITFSKAIGFHSMPKNAKVLGAHYSKPLTKILKEMLKDSDNLTTDAIFKKIGEKYYKKQGTWQNSLQALKLILGPVTNIDFCRTTLSDGAGLSRYNLITPLQLSNLLYYIYNNRKIRDSILDALPIAGKDGTLKSRMLELGKHQRIHAKTGSMTGVTALAGFVHSKHNGPLSFVIMINGIVGKRVPYITLENNICRFLVNAP